ncbi:OXA1-like protein, partial [Metarhizium majus ARSEF 297]
MLGGVSSSRQFSLWGYGKKKTPEEEPAASKPETTTTTSEAVRPVDPTPENVVPSPPTEPAVPASEVDLSSISDIVNGQDILNMSEQIGYLKALGLDFGTGPTSVMQWALEHVHIYSGLGWGASIMATAVLLRCIMFYPQVRSLKFNAVMQNLRKDPRSQEAMKLVQQGFANQDNEMRQKGQYLNKMLKEQYGVNNWGMLWSFGQIPFTFGLFRIVSGMANVPVPAMETAGYLWFTDLTATDPYFILPAAGTALMVGALAINAKHTPESQKKMLKTMTYVFGVVGFIGTTFLSAGVNLMTVALGASTLITAIVLNNALVRRTVGLPPHPTASSTAPQKTTYEAPRAANTPEPGLRERLESSLNDMKKGMSDQITNYTGTYSGTDEEKAERKRKELMRKLEDTRKQQEREEFEKKYKTKS